ncbi:dihydroneopterin aldolase [Octadecabacter temperatus]|uniref:Dihydroneopterin aldolase n=1 Tax=Octadecabacter temperatus TaxID=1458307 RepID=A0A0K0Y3L2_9RHOB|nr:dihydroneopterin aldolase [Octadecabacter temperatus]AKS45529.1 Dihydroneopterin aldolase [Octadecabacter temperatus]SIN94978.1 dihydroneopterin aldolase [Octadecabacter temperatus]
MSSDTKLAFAHPSERAEATAPNGNGGLRDRISLRDYITEVEIGAFQQERGHLQRIKFNVVVEVEPLTGPIDDDVDRILSYDRVTEAIDYELGAERLNLLETLAARIAERILLEPQALRVFVRIEKIDRGPFSLGVEIMREQGGDDGAAVEVMDEPHPRMAYLSNDTIRGDRLTAIIDALSADDVPLIFCVGAGDTPAPSASVTQAQRRIDLLSIEQNAWVLAGRDKRCVVVETRTELDWAMKNGQTCVWAPSKAVLDASDSPDTTDGLVLAAWFAGELQALELVVAGVDAPPCDVPVRTL